MNFTISVQTNICITIFNTLVGAKFSKIVYNEGNSI